MGPPITPCQRLNHLLVSLFKNPIWIPQRRKKEKKKKMQNILSYTFSLLVCPFDLLRINEISSTNSLAGYLKVVLAFP